MDENRVKPFPGVGKSTLYLLDWSPYPRKHFVPEFSNTPEIIAVFLYGEIAETLGGISLQIDRLSRSKIRDLDSLCKEIGATKEKFYDTLLVAHSLTTWLEKFICFHTGTGLENKLRNVHVGALLYDYKEQNFLERIFSEDDADKIRQKIEISMRQIEILNSANIEFRKTPHLFTDSWTFLSINPVKLFKPEATLANKEWELPWESIAKVLLSIEKAEKLLGLINKGNRNYLTIELAIHDIVLSHDDAVSYVSALDWAYACDSKGKGKNSQYIKMRKRFEHVFKNSEKIFKQ
jgi:hypothetical protein